MRSIVANAVFKGSQINKGERLGGERERGEEGESERGRE
jgi:hypothetical protein